VLFIIITFLLYLLRPPKEGSYPVTIVYPPDYSISDEQILMKFFEGVGHGPWNKKLSYRLETGRQQRISL